MIWLEIISVRTAGRAERMNALELCKQIRSHQVAERSAKIMVFCNISYETDLSIHIHWDSGSMRPAKSSLGIQLTELLKHHGLVNHTVWDSLLEETIEHDP